MLVQTKDDSKFGSMPTESAIFTQSLTGRGGSAAVASREVMHRCAVGAYPISHPQSIAWTATNEIWSLLIVFPSLCIGWPGRLLAPCSALLVYANAKKGTKLETSRTRQQRRYLKRFREHKSAAQQLFESSRQKT